MSKSKKNDILTKFGVEKLKDRLFDYFDAHLDLVKFDIEDSVSDKIANASVILISVLSVSAFLFFSSFFVAILINTLFENPYSGFGIVALFYFLITIPIIFLKKPIKKLLKKHITLVDDDTPKKWKKKRKKRKV
jgi:uncharacterized membrane protein YbhN (UPF0104 family)